MASPFITVQFKNVTGTVKYFGNITNWFQVEMKRLTEQQAEDGAGYMKALMPHGKSPSSMMPGAMIQALSTDFKKGGYSIIVRTPKGRNWQGRTNVPYQVYYNVGQRGAYKGHTKSGSYRFFERTSGYLLGKYPELIDRELDKQLRRK